MDLGTTTYAGRHRRLLEGLAALAPAGPLRVLEVGPGLAVRGLGRLASRGVPGRAVFKGLETLVRRLPLPDGAYENYETEDLLAAFGRGRVDLTLLDINPRSLAVIAANLAPLRVTTVNADLADAALPRRPELAGRFDVIVALSTIGRIPEERRQAAADNLVRLARPGGLVAEDTGRFAGGPLQRTSCENVFRRPHDQRR
ncbi:MAG: class I SAM-dependent methyltransferase [Bauldia sp.]|nr:class I SAM-dependent methyltransferase [Bauldia sp.]